MGLPMMKRVWIAAIIFYTALFSGLCLYDERPDPDMERETATPLPELIEPGNAWIVMLGLGAPSATSPFEWGKKIMQRAKDAALSGKATEEAPLLSYSDIHRISFRGKLPSFHDAQGKGMMPYAAAHADAIAESLRLNRELVQRYEALRDCPRYTEPLDWGFSAPLPSFLPVRNVQRLILLRLAVEAGKGDMVSALEQVREDAEFWRLTSRRSTTILSKMISIAMVGTDIRFAAELGANRTLTEREKVILHDILRPFDHGETSLTAAFHGEARYFLKGMDLTLWNRKNRSFLETILFKPNATRNRMYSYWRSLIRLSELPPPALAQEMKKYEKGEVFSARIGLPFLYNPAGEILAVVGQSNFPANMEKGHNLEGLRRLALLKVQSLTERIPPDRMQRFLETRTADLGNPYTGRAMTWNQKTGGISFQDISGKTTEIFL
jgi:hypothetical protein